MKAAVKYTLTAVLAVAFAVGIAVLARHSRSQRALVTCSGLEVVFRDSLNFVTEEDVKTCLDREYGTYVGQQIDSVRLFAIEDMLESRSAVKECEAWTTSDGTLHVAITQRKPAVRFKKGDAGCYADASGYIFPLHKSYTAAVPLVEGDLPISIKAGHRGEADSPEEREWIASVLNLIGTVESRSFKHKVRGMKVRPGGDFVLQLDTLKEHFVIGYPDHLDEKFARVDKYIGWIRPAKGDYYKTVNVKYNKQIICRKDI